MSIQIVSDSAADLLPSEARSLGVHILPLTVNFGGREYADSIELSHKEFFEKLIETDTLPTTSQISPAVFSDCFAKLTEQGDTVICITISSKLSGTYQSACIAAQDFGSKVLVVDSLSATVGQRLLVLTALEYRRNGMCAEEIAAALNEDKKKICILAMLDTLEYLKRGGRISPTVAFAGELLSIKPVITVEDGAVVLKGKARGSKNASNLLRKMVEEVGIDFARPFCLVYSGLTDTVLQKYIADSTDLWKDYTRDLPIASIGAVIGTHIGPNAAGLAFFMK